MSAVRFHPKAPKNLSFAGVAQLAEQLICNQQVAGSIPVTSSNTILKDLYGRIAEWPNASDCKSDVSDFGGSNPPPPTTKMALTIVSAIFASYKL